MVTAAIADDLDVFKYLVEKGGAISENVKTTVVNSGNIDLQLYLDSITKTLEASYKFILFNDLKIALILWRMFMFLHL